MCSRTAYSWVEACTYILSLWELQKDVFSEKEHRSCGICPKLICLHLLILIRTYFKEDLRWLRWPHTSQRSHCSEPTVLATCKEYTCWKWAWCCNQEKSSTTAPRQASPTAVTLRSPQVRSAESPRSHIPS